MSNNTEKISRAEIDERAQRAQRAINEYCDAVNYTRPCDICEDPICGRKESVCPYEYAEDIGLWTLYTQEHLEEAYYREQRAKYPSNPFRYSHSMGSWIVGSNRSSLWQNNANLVDLIDEYESYASLIYEFSFTTQTGKDHAHSFSGVLSAMMDDPVHFYIPENAKEQYSSQELRLLALVRARLCSDNDELPVTYIVDARCAEDSRIGENAFDKAVQQKIEDLLVKVHLD